MNDSMSQSVKSILSTARQRGPYDRTISVSSRSLKKAIETKHKSSQIPIIAELKPTSPSGDHSRDLDPVTAAQKMSKAGAAAISVLTEPTHFNGSLDALTKVRNNVDIPVLRKDFILYEDHLDAVEADIILLIVRFLEESLETMLEAAHHRGFDVLVETHTEDEIQTAIAAGADYIGINNRDLTDLQVDLSTFEGLAHFVPSDITLIAESGLHSHSDVQRMIEAGADAVLIGNAIMDGNIEQNIQELLGS
ncbi:MAG: indole-3-glycerol-phosphate synthase [Halobacteriaceae archaeon]